MQHNASSSCSACRDASWTHSQPWHLPSCFTPLSKRVEGEGLLLSRIPSPILPHPPLPRSTPACARLLPLAARSSLILRQSSPGKTAAVDHSGESSQTLSSDLPAAQQGTETHCPWDNSGRVPLNNAALGQIFRALVRGILRFEVCRGYSNILLLYPSCSQAPGV